MSGVKWIVGMPALIRIQTRLECSWKLAAIPLLHATPHSSHCCKAVASKLWWPHYGRHTRPAFVLICTFVVESRLRISLQDCPRTWASSSPVHAQPPIHHVPTSRLLNQYMQQAITAPSMPSRDYSNSPSAHVTHSYAVANSFGNVNCVDAKPAADKPSSLHQQQLQLQPRDANWAGGPSPENRTNTSLVQGGCQGGSSSLGSQDTTVFGCGNGSFGISNQLKDAGMLALAAIRELEQVMSGKRWWRSAVNLDFGTAVWTWRGFPRNKVLH